MSITILGLEPLQSLHMFILHKDFLIKHKHTRILKYLKWVLGTGLNLLLTCLAAKELDVTIDYYALELHPLNEEEVHSLNYDEWLKLSDEDQQTYQKIHSMAWNQWNPLTSQINFFKCQDSLVNSDLPEDIDVVYFDAFSPAIQPELWSLDIF